MFLAPFITEIVAGIGAIAAVTSTVMSVNASNEALAEQNKAIETQELTNNYKKLVRQNQTLDQMQLALQKNEAHQAASGFTFASPSFFATSHEIAKEGAKAYQNAEVASALNDYALKMQQREAQTQASLRRIQLISSGISQVAQSYMSYNGLKRYRTRLEYGENA